MHRNNRQTLEERVTQAAEAALADHDYVSVIDVLTGIRLLEPVHVESWRKGRIPFLESMIQGSAEKVRRAFSLYGDWVREKGLRPSDTPYVRSGRDGTVDL